MAVDFVNKRTAPLVAVYAAVPPGAPTSPAVDEMLMIEPPPACRNAGIACFVPRKTPLTLTAMMRSQSSSDVSSILARKRMPALLTSTFSLPYEFTAVATAARQSASRVTFRCTYVALPPEALISASTFLSSSLRMSPSTTAAPSRTNIRPSTAPCPRAPPLISATLPSSRPMGISLCVPRGGREHHPLPVEPPQPARPYGYHTGGRRAIVRRGWRNPAKIAPWTTSERPSFSPASLARRDTDGIRVVLSHAAGRGVDRAGGVRLGTRADAGRRGARLLLGVDRRASLQRLRPVPGPPRPGRVRAGAHDQPAPRHGGELAAPAPPRRPGRGAGRARRGQRRAARCGHRARRHPAGLPDL